MNQLYHLCFVMDLGLAVARYDDEEQKRLINAALDRDEAAALDRLLDDVDDGGDGRLVLPRDNDNG